MNEHVGLSTERLRLRHWRPADREPFAALNADPEVMAYFPDRLTREQSDRVAARIEADLERDGYGLWALETKAGGEFVGFTGLSPVTYETHFTPAVEVGWRLARAAWGQGYATEAARAALAFGFDEAGLEEIVSFATVGNTRSRAVMERIGMERDPDGDFEHPSLPVGHPLAPHVLYRIAAPGR
jgi:ribosomal-protein-alanine N-acetyltransferase